MSKANAMSAIARPLPEAPAAWNLPYRGKVGMACLILAEFAIFTIFVVAYLFYVGKSLSGPTPREVLETPIFYTVCLLSSSLTIHLAGKFLERGRQGAFLGSWLLTIILGGLFLYGTGQEWYRLIYEHGLTISTNVLLSVVLFLSIVGRVGPEQSARVDVLSLYWHFVDAVWVVVFIVVYVLGR
jgi:cytochrome c oxidase subunit III